MFKWNWTRYASKSLNLDAYKIDPKHLLRSDTRNEASVSTFEVSNNKRGEKKINIHQNGKLFRGHLLSEFIDTNSFSANCERFRSTISRYISPSLVYIYEYTAIWKKKITNSFATETTNSSHLFPCINSYCIRFAFIQIHLIFEFIRIRLSFFRSHIKCEGLSWIGGCVRIWKIPTDTRLHVSTIWLILNF